MNVVSSKTFKSGNSVALRLPRELAIEPDVKMTIERDGEVLTVRPAHDPAEEKRKLTEFIAALRALPKPPYVEARDIEDLPERPGL